jgi:hypothetical protein
VPNGFYSFCEKSLQSLKRYLRDDFFEVKSLHLTEAIAVSLGYGKRSFTE